MSTERKWKENYFVRNKRKTGSHSFATASSYTAVEWLEWWEPKWDFTPRRIEARRRRTKLYKTTVDYGRVMPLVEKSRYYWNLPLRWWVSAGVVISRPWVRRPFPACLSADNITSMQRETPAISNGRQSQECYGYSPLRLLPQFLLVSCEAGKQLIWAMAFNIG